MAPLSQESRHARLYLSRHRHHRRGDRHHFDESPRRLQQTAPPAAGRAGLWPVVLDAQPGGQDHSGRRRLCGVGRPGHSASQHRCHVLVSAAPGPSRHTRHGLNRRGCSGDPAVL
ncbi:UNVERIFIED_CONTAM: hypothetical protein NCL1_60257, partial [Trichonephila clavipes]